MLCACLVFAISKNRSTLGHNLLIICIILIDIYFWQDNRTGFVNIFCTILFFFVLQTYLILCHRTLIRDSWLRQRLAVRVSQNRRLSLKVAESSPSHQSSSRPRSRILIWKRLRNVLTFWHWCFYFCMLRLLCFHNKVRDHPYIMYAQKSYFRTPFSVEPHTFCGPPSAYVRMYKLAC